MRVRARSRSQQWAIWLGVALVLLAVYDILTGVLYNPVGWSLSDPRCHRVALPLLALLFWIARETRWDGVARRGGRGDAADGVVPAPAVERQRPSGHEVGSGGRRPAAGAAGRRERPVEPLPPGPGSALYAKAREIPHRWIPVFPKDAPYLELLGESVAQGYAPAMVKLGEYAIRRSAWVEAYYWMTRARRSGAQEETLRLQEIRTNWARDGFPSQTTNVNKLFTSIASSLGHALLCIDSGHDVIVARKFLQKNFPDALGEGKVA